MVTARGINSYATAVTYYSQSEFTALTAGCAASAPTGKSVTGSVAGISGTQFGYVSLGGVTASTNVANPNFQLSNVASGTQDLVAYRAAGFTLSAGDRIVVHRDQNIASGGSTGVIDFSAADAVAPATANITVTGGAVSSAFETLDYLTGATCSVAQLNFTTNSAPSPITIYGVPSSIQRPSDFHELILNQINTAADTRNLYLAFHAIGDRSVAIGAGVGPVTVTAVAGTYKRYQAGFTLAPDYQTFAFQFSGTSTAGNFAATTLVQSPGYFGSNTAINVTTPDFSAVDGYQAVWAPSTSSPLEYYITVSSTPPATFCSEGAMLRTASSGTGAV